MKKSQYIIESLEKPNIAIRWEGKVILFDTQEEAEEFVETFPEHFEDYNFRLSKGVYFLNNFINYKDFKETLEFKKEINKRKENYNGEDIKGSIRHRFITR